MLSYVFIPDDWDIFYRNVRWLSKDYTALYSYLRRLISPFKKQVDVTRTLEVRGSNPVPGPTVLTEEFRSACSLLGQMPDANCIRSEYLSFISYAIHCSPTILTFEQINLRYWQIPEMNRTQVMTILVQVLSAYSRVIVLYRQSKTISVTGNWVL